MSDPICSNCGKSVLECQGFCEPKKAMSLRDQVAKILNDYADGVSEGGNVEPYIDAIITLITTKSGEKIVRREK